MCFGKCENVGCENEAVFSQGNRAVCEVCYHSGEDFWEESDLGADQEYDSDEWYDDSMDGDFDSAMRDAGYGTDEDYGGDCWHY